MKKTATSETAQAVSSCIYTVYAEKMYILRNCLYNEHLCPVSTILMLNFGDFV